MIELTIDGEFRGPFLNPAEAWPYLERVYELLDDQYSGCVHWHVHDLQTGKHCNNLMPAALWYAYAETPSAFNQWLRLFGYNDTDELDNMDSD